LTNRRVWSLRHLNNIHWLSIEKAFQQLNSGSDGLTAAAAERLIRENVKWRRKSDGGAWRLLLNQFRSPLVILLLAAISISFVSRRFENGRPAGHCLILDKLFVIALRDPAFVSLLLPCHPICHFP
jgi:hypothetical protein